MIVDVKRDDKVINKVYHGRELIFERDSTVNYIFPNANAKMTSNTSLGMACYFSTQYGGTNTAYKAFDNDPSTVYRANRNSGTNDRIAIVLPFLVNLKSVKIINSNKTGGKGIKDVTIYVSEDVKKSDFTTSSANSFVYASAKDREDKLGIETEHLNSAYDKPVRSICIYGTAWYSNTIRSIAEVILNFDVSNADLTKWANEYGIQLN